MTAQPTPAGSPPALEATSVQVARDAHALDALADDIAADFGTRPSVLVARSGDPAEAVLATARALPCDLIAIGATPRPARLARVLCDRTRDALVRQADCPVMVVPPGAALPIGDCVAVAYDASGASAAAVAAQLASAVAGCLTVIHVLADPRSGSRPVLPMHRAVREHVDAALDGEEIDLRHVSAYRLPAAHLAQAVAEVRPALLVVPAPPRANWRTVLRPSISAQLLRRASLPIVVVPRGAVVRAKRATLATV